MSPVKPPFLKLELIQGDRRALEVAAVWAIVFDPAHLADYFDRLAPAGKLTLVNERPCALAEPCDPCAPR